LRLAATAANHYNPGSTHDGALPEMHALRSTIRLVPRLAAAVALAIAIVALAIAVVASARADSSASVLLVVGDSISAGYGLAKGTGWVDLLAARIDAKKLPFRVVNASITGDTTAGGRARMPSLLAQHKPSVVVVELGGNDGLRGGNLRSTRDNLETMIAAIRKSGAKAVLAGMKLPPNYGPAYTREFDALFGDVAKAQGATLVPFLFEGFGESGEWFQQDRIHPTAAAQPKLLDNVWPALAPLLVKTR
jgi:acyl-CoA thioesterase-1